MAGASGRPRHERAPAPLWWAFAAAALANAWGARAAPAAAQTTAVATMTPGVSAAYVEGEALYRAKNYTGALREFRVDAGRGYAPAQFRVGQLALLGKGGPRNASNAEHYHVGGGAGLRRGANLCGPLPRPNISVCRAEPERQVCCAQSGGRNRRRAHD